MPVSHRVGRVINDGKPIVVGTTNEVEPPISFDIALPSGYNTSDPSRYGAYPFAHCRLDLADAARRAHPAHLAVGP